MSMDYVWTVYVFVWVMVWVPDTGLRLSWNHATAPSRTSRSPTWCVMELE